MDKERIKKGVAIILVVITLELLFAYALHFVFPHISNTLSPAFWS